MWKGSLHGFSHVTRLLSVLLLLDKKWVQLQLCLFPEHFLGSEAPFIPCYHFEVPSQEACPWQRSNAFARAGPSSFRSDCFVIYNLPVNAKDLTQIFFYLRGIYCKDLEYRGQLFASIRAPDLKGELRTTSYNLICIRI